MTWMTQPGTLTPHFHLTPPAPSPRRLHLPVISLRPAPVPSPLCVTCVVLVRDWAAFFPPLPPLFKFLIWVRDKE
ncbi:hypothetical protein PIB30_023103 [Stylosanthes scabra]|uniref:Uncharacterized protein n=1 Tax=Stylosanthes scabra TaxID=79078 RepID=A0ABU6Z7N6_9FABA|nr:hypothetical protein [Stylosanthes scabra]